MIHVYGHPRSGNNLLMHLLARNFYPDEDLSTSPGKVGHWAARVKNQKSPVGQLGGTHHFYGYKHNKLYKPILYVYRDGRDVALSLWKTKAFLHPDWREMGFSEFLRQNLDWWGSPGNNDPYGKPIAAHWHDHLESWYEVDGVLFVRFEDILLDPGSVVARAAVWSGLEPVEELQEVDKPVGWFPHGGKVGKWRDKFTPEDEEYFYSLCPRGFWGYWEQK